MVLFSSNIIMAQDKLNLSAEKSKVEIHGDSNVHKWEENAEEMTGSITASLDNGNLQNITSFELKIPVEGIESGKGAMNDKTYKALKAKNHKNITMTLNNVDEIKSIGNGQYNVTATGSLTIAGTQKSITFTAKATATSGSIKIQGELPIKMSEYNVEPPTAMMGAVKCYDDVNVKYELVLQ